MENTTNLNEPIETEPEVSNIHEMFMYLVHAFPYTQSAFNWLFYAFLNHNLRHSSRCSLATRSTATVTGDIGPTTSVTGNAAPLWRNLQNMGNYLKNASMDTGSTILRYSPFHLRLRSRYLLIKFFNL